MKSLSFHPAARAELFAATGWYIERSRQAAELFAQEIEHGTSRIIEAPSRFPRAQAGTRRFVLLHFPYSIIYRVAGDNVEIVAIAHHKRRPGYWSQR